MGLQLSGSVQLEGNLLVTGSANSVFENISVTNRITANEINVQFVSSSIIYSSGSNKFGDEITDNHQFTGSLIVSGTLAMGIADKGVGRISFNESTNTLRIQSSKDGTACTPIEFWSQRDGGGFAQSMIISGSNTGLGGHIPNASYGPLQIKSPASSYTLDLVGRTAGLNGESQISFWNAAQSSILASIGNVGDKLLISADSVDVSGSITMDSTEFVKLPVGTTAQRPGSPVVGMTRLNTDDNFLEFYNGTSWELTSGHIPIEYVVVGGGGNGAGHTTGGSLAIASAPGGAGGYRSSVVGENTGGGLPAEKRFLVNINTSYSVSVGTAANNSNLGGIVALAGGVGRGGNGGSGGGADFANTTGGLGTAGQGFDGGDSSFQDASGGGGGASGVGSDAASNVGGNGGNGVASSITGTSVTRAGGGGGSGTTPGTGGTGGGASGKSTTGNGNDASTANSGGGGGGAFSTSAGAYSGGSGASGVVIVRYPSTLVVTVSAGLTSSTSTIGNNKITEFTAGSGTIMFSKV
jgi:hypothetical protein